MTATVLGWTLLSVALFGAATLTVAAGIRSDRVDRMDDLIDAINQAWAITTSTAADLIAWLQLLALPTALKACEPKALRYRFLHVPAAPGADHASVTRPPGRDTPGI